MSEQQDADAVTLEKKPIQWEDFLSSTPPGNVYVVANVLKVHKGGYARPINSIDIVLHCESKTCNGTRRFYLIGEPEVLCDGNGLLQERNIFLVYKCRNCLGSTKEYALTLFSDDSRWSQSAYAYKFGELPHYGASVPDRVLSIFGRDRDIFLKGRRCESQGLGIGAFAYYRQVVEKHKDRLITEIHKAATKLGASDEILKSLENAKTQYQFTKAIEQIKPAVPQALLINGRNPLTLLHNALSKGIHIGTDADCLEDATAVRLVLIAMVERIQKALEESEELNTAVTHLIKTRQPAGSALESSPSDTPLLEVPTSE